MTFNNQKELFDYIWKTRKHVSELTGITLLPKGHPQWHWQFLHILGKGAYPSYKLKEENIILARPEEHERQEQFAKFRERRDELKAQYAQEHKVRKI